MAGAYNLNPEEQLLFDSGIYHEKRRLMKLLGVDNAPIDFDQYLLQLEKQAIAWGLLEEVLPPKVNSIVAANLLVREIKKARGE